MSQTVKAMKQLKETGKGGGKGTALAFVLPAVFLHAMMVTIPALSTIYMAFYDWNGLSDGKFVGIANFVEIFTKDTVFWHALGNNFKWLIFFLFVPTIIGLAVALVVIRQKKGQLIYRSIYFLPYVLSSVVAGKIWSALYSPYFGLPKIFKMLGLTKLGSIMWLGDPQLALFSVAFVDNWHYWGFIMVLMIAALHQVDDSLYEAASIEGANKVQSFIHVTVPGIAPTLVFAIMTTMMWSFTTFDYIWSMTKGGPGQATEILSTWIYKNAFINYRAGYADAICVVQMLFVVVVFLIQQRLRKVSEGYQI